MALPRDVAGALRLNLGPGTHYAHGWDNLDVAAAAAAGIRCDTIVDGAAPFAGFATGSAAQVNLSHVLEHVPWPKVHELLTDVYRVLAPGGRVLAVGPDVFRSLEQWKAGTGQMPWDLLTVILEHADQNDGEWLESVHWWNCHSERLLGALRRAGFADVYEPPYAEFADWPIQNWSGWQCAAFGTKP